MIDIAKLTESDKGREVSYFQAVTKKFEYGTLSSWNERWIFVRYSWGVAACGPENLEFTS